jgi:A/G-specific adenine glycosylase
MPWREDTRPYYVLVSELMLQQTQVARVITKFEAFVERFPDEQALAIASLADVLVLWQGLGYNRRAKYLHDTTKMVAQEFGGTLPNTEADLVKLPGVGKNTAGAILAYAFNQPVLFVETNIRTVYIHHLFHDNFSVSDAQIIEKLEQTIDRQNPRRFYQALMDYGTWLKANGVKNNVRSKHYKKQPPLKGSIREVRGQIIAALSQSEMTQLQLQKQLVADERFEAALHGLVRDGLVEKNAKNFHLTK